MRIVQVANFVHDTSGGIRTALDALGSLYVDAGHEVMTIRPGPRHHMQRDGIGRVAVVLPGTPLPASGGYRLLVRRAPLAAIIASWRPDVVEVSDKTTLGWVGSLARELGAASVLFSHERLDLVMGDHLRAARLMRRAAGWHQRRFVDGFDLVVCASQFAAAEFDTLTDVKCAIVPLGVDLELFHPDRRHSITRPCRPFRAMLVGRLTRDKQPLIASQAVSELRWRGIDVELVVAGDGPMRRKLTAVGATTGVRMLGHVRDRVHLAALIADADAVISPGRRETFGLAALEALASGTPLVAVDEGALSELVVPGAGVTCRLDADSFADGLSRILGGDRRAQRVAARARAEQYQWNRSGRALLERYETLVGRRRLSA
jgi:alpha-1,6-mannosyltransferase